MSAAQRLASRRDILRGLLGGSAVSVALPFLDCFLDTNGTALAATGAPLPNRFATWFWGCGLTPGRWEPKTTGADYEMPPQLAPLTPFRDRLSIFSNFKVFLDGNALQPHGSGMRGVLNANVTKQGDPSLDVLVADAIGPATRFRSLTVAATGNPTHTTSQRSASLVNSAEGSPAALYARLFGPEFRDPNAAEFRPDPRIMASRSVLSAIKDQRDGLMMDLGAADKARLDEYFTSLREIEQQLSLQLEKPAPLEACSVPAKVKDAPHGTEMDVVNVNHSLFARLLAHAIACDQTRVLSISISDGPSSLRKAGEAVTHHIRTHEDPIDEKLGYQPEVKWFEDEIIGNLANLAAALNGVREGGGTLLDRTLVYAFSECGFAKSHTLENMPLLLVGGAGGRIRTGVHVTGGSEPASRVGLTIQQGLGLGVSSWGAGSMRTSKSIGELLV